MTLTAVSSNSVTIEGQGSAIVSSSISMGCHTAPLIARQQKAPPAHSLAGPVLRSDRLLLSEALQICGNVIEGIAGKCTIVLEFVHGHHVGLEQSGG